VKTFADWIKANLEATGKIPSLSLAQVRDRRDEGENVFRREGRSWTIRYDGKVISLPHTKGMHYMAILLSHPRRAFPVLTLYYKVGGTPEIGTNDTFSKMSKEQLAKEGLSISSPEDLRDKARKAVCIAIQRCFKIIEKEHPALHQHLKNTIKTGFSCSYTPDKPTPWKL
jgi:hypothetical protein